MLETMKIGYRVNGYSILNEVSLSTSPGEVVALIGPNGSGKTTLFNVINGFVRQTSGEVRIGGRCVDTLPVEARVSLGVGRLWQDLRLFLKMSCIENLLVAVRETPSDDLWRVFLQKGKINAADVAATTKAGRLLESVGLSSKKDVEVENLSFGQQKLVALCRLCMNNASILLLDEPYAGVNYVLVGQINSLITKMKEEQKSILIIEHNIGLVQQIAGRMYAMDEGRIIAEGTPENVTTSKIVREAYAGI